MIDDIDDTALVGEGVLSVHRSMGKRYVEVALADDVGGLSLSPPLARRFALRLLTVADLIDPPDPNPTNDPRLSR